MDPRQQEAIDKVAKMVINDFQGSYKSAFRHYDKNGDGRVTAPELITLLYDAGIGIKWTRETWAEKIIEAVDKSGDNSISWEEFEAELAKQ